MQLLVTIQANEIHYFIAMNLTSLKAHDYY